MVKNRIFPLTNKNYENYAIFDWRGKLLSQIFRNSLKMCSEIQQIFELKRVLKVFRKNQDYIIIKIRQK